MVRHVTLSVEDFCLLKKSLGPFKMLLAASHPSTQNRAFAKETVEELERKIVAIITNPVQWIQEMSIDYNEMLILQTSLWIYGMQYLIFAPECVLLQKKLKPISESYRSKARFN
jgi:hypothetical protein